MNKTTLVIFNKLRRDTLIKLAYASRYFDIEMTYQDAETVYKAIQTQVNKSKSAKINTKELVTA